jgi:hypothetical protein
VTPSKVMVVRSFEVLAAYILQVRVPPNWVMVFMRSSEVLAAYILQVKGYAQLGHGHQKL